MGSGAIQTDTEGLLQFTVAADVDSDKEITLSPNTAFNYILQ